MEEQLISFETAKLAKEKGFNAGCDGRWYIEPASDWKYSKQGLFKCDNTGDSISRPTQTILQKWLREVHNIEVFPMIYPKEIREKMGLCKYNFFIMNEDWNPTVPSNGSFSDCFEDAFELGLQEALKLIN